MFIIYYDKVRTQPLCGGDVLLKNISLVSFYILSEEGRESKKKDFTILFVPRKTMLCERKLAVSKKYRRNDLQLNMSLGLTMDLLSAY